MWVSPQWQRSVDTRLLWTEGRKSQFSCFTLDRWGGFIYKHGHASDLKTISPLKGQVRKRIKIRSFCRERCWNALLRPDTVQSTKWWADGHLRTIKTCIIHNRNSQCGLPWGSKSSACWSSERGKETPQGRLSFIFPPAQLTLFVQTAIWNTKLHKLPARLA